MSAERQITELNQRIAALEKILQRQMAIEVTYGSGGAPTNAQYVLVALDGTLTDDRKLTAGTNIALADGGAGGNLTVSVSPQGSGSSLDADTVDGVQLSAILQKSEVGIGLTMGAALDLDINELTESTSPDGSDMIPIYDVTVAAVRKMTRNNILSGTTAATATETAQGVIELATQTETDTGTDDARAVTPLKLASRPAFLAYLSASSTAGETGDGTQYNIICNTEIYDTGSDYNTANGQFTAPVTGRYNFSFGVSLESMTSSHTDMDIILATSNRNYYAVRCNPWAINRQGAGSLTLSNAVVGVDMESADIAFVTIYVYNGTKVVNVTGGAAGNFYTWFGGELAGAGP